MKSSVVRKLQLHNRDTWHRNQTFIDIRKYETSEMWNVEMEPQINYCKIISLTLKPYNLEVCHLLFAVMSPVSKFGCLSPFCGCNTCNNSLWRRTQLLGPTWRHMTRVAATCGHCSLQPTFAKFSQSPEKATTCWKHTNAKIIRNGWFG